MEPLPAGRIERCIYFVRGQRVMLDSDLARIYGVSTARLNQQVGRNLRRFPADFVFRLTRPENESLMLHFATSNIGRGGRRNLPLVFTEHGAIMLASVLNSPVAIEASVHVVRAFVRLREMLATHERLARRVARLESRSARHGRKIRSLFEAIAELTRLPEPPRRQIGFRP